MTAGLAVARPPAAAPSDGNRLRSPAALADDLIGALDGEVRFDDGSRALYSRDASNYRQTPIGVVVPRSTKDITLAIAICRQHGAPVVGRGGGTSLAGQSVNEAVVIDTSKYLNRVLEIDAERHTARVEPGVILDDLRLAAERHGLTFGPDPATHAWCTLGGMIANNSCGIHSVMAGTTSNNVEELEVLTYDGLRMHVGPTSDEDYERLAADPGRRGEIYRRLRDLRDRYADEIRRRMPDLPRRVSGYSLDELLPENGFNVARALVGTEGTCALTLSATLRLVPSPQFRALAVLGYPDVNAAADDVPAVIETGPVGLEGMDERLVGFMERKGLRSESLGLLPDGGGWLLAEFGGDTAPEAEGRARDAVERLTERRGRTPTAQLYTDPDDEHRVWQVRESGLGATAFVPGMDDTWPGWEDSAVPPERLGDYLRRLRRLMDEFDYHGSFYGHFGQGCLHTRIDFELTTADGVADYRRFIERAADLVVEFGGSLSGEHGDGQARAELLPRMYGDELVAAFRAFKSIWDPAGRMNPHKVVDPYPTDSNITVSAKPRLDESKLHFRYPDDDGVFARATLRCVGVGKCRDTRSGTMCPSYMVLEEEAHTTRGRAHLLHEMSIGETITDGWRSEEVKEALDLCLGCKGCRGDCPVDVDVGTYKAEFLSHYYAGRLRPRAAYAFGLIFYWARLAALAPTLANTAAHMPLIRGLAKQVAGIDQRRAIPAFAAETFRSWSRRHEPTADRRPAVVLWADTFTNNLEPHVAQSARAVLEAAGRRVIVPQEWACCGRPVYDFGMLDLGKRLLRRSIDVLRPYVEADLPIVGLEPSCVAVFRDELRNLFPDDEEAMRLHDRFQTLGEFLASIDWQPPQLDGRAIVQGHCQQNAVIGTHAEESQLVAVGIDAELLDSGCCGMAGPFGFEAGEKYDVSIAAGERVLLPRVRTEDRSTFVVADGFSCREQIAQQTDRRALHTAQLLHLALEGGSLLGSAVTPELAYAEMMDRGVRYRLRQPVSQRLLLGAGVAAGGLLVAAAARRLRRGDVAGGRFGRASSRAPASIGA